MSWYWYSYEQLEFHAQLSWAWKKFYNLGARWEEIYCLLPIPAVQAQGLDMPHGMLKSP